MELVVLFKKPAGTVGVLLPCEPLDGDAGVHYKAHDPSL